MPITPEEQRYLKRKHQGGENNKRGSVYENLYTVFCIAVLLDKYPRRLNDVHFSSQVENVFVDDLLIEEPESGKIYHQLKDVKGLTWNVSNLRGDFKRQMELSEEIKERFQLKLVYSDEESLVKEIPEEISRCTTVVLFPACTSIGQLIQSCRPFREAILNVTKEEDGDYDKLFGVAGALLGAWDGIEQRKVTLREVLDKVRLVGGGYVNLRTYPDVEISEESKMILDKCGIHFYVSGIKLYWSGGNGRLRGEIEWTPELERSLQENVPVNMFEAIKLLG